MISQAQLSRTDNRIRTYAALASLMVAFVTITLKFWAYNITHSQAIYSDALEGIVNVLTALVGILVIYYASKPADEDHPYGHGKVEYFSATFEGALIIFAAIFVVIESVQAHLEGRGVSRFDEGAFLIALAGVINFVYGWVLKGVGRKYASPTLESAGVHLTVDFWTTIGAMVGVFLVKLTGLIWIDRLVAIILGANMAYAGGKLILNSLAGLMDAEDVKILKQLAEIFEKHVGPGIIQIHHTKVIRSGWYHHIDAHLVVPEFWTVEHAHAHLDEFENKVIRDYKFGGEANFHLDPCKRKYCTVCDYPDCPVRIEDFQARMPVKLSHLRSKTEPKSSDSSS